MKSKYWLSSILVVICLVLASLLRAQDNLSDDAELKEFLKQAAEMQKKATGLQKQNPT